MISTSTVFVLLLFSKFIVEPNNFSGTMWWLTMLWMHHRLEPRKKPALLSIESWLVTRDPCNVFLSCGQYIQSTVYNKSQGFFSLLNSWSLWNSHLTKLGISSSSCIFAERSNLVLKPYMIWGFFFDWAHFGPKHPYSLWLIPREKKHNMLTCYKQMQQHKGHLF